MLKVYFIGYGGHAHYAEALRPIINELEMTLTTIHEWENADVKWNLSTWREELNKADIVICPTDPGKFGAKSANKLTQALSMGKPVICSSLDAYKKLQEDHGECCLFADTPEEWKEQLKKLRDDPQLRSSLSQKGLIASKDYHIDRIGEKWVKVILNLDKVDIVIPTYKNLRGLQHCIDSIRKCTDIKYRIIVVNNGNSEELHKYLEQQGDLTYIRKAPLNFAQAVNEGIRAGSSKYVMILNDDVIVSKGWLKTLVDTCNGSVGAVGPLSNCDMGWLHQYKVNVQGVDLLPGLNTFEQIEPIIPDIYEFKSPFNETPDREWVAFYCTLIPREVLNKTGLLNEEFTNSGEDVDLCYRIKKQGFKIVQNFNSFVFHFGAVSRKMLEQENPGSYHEADKKTNNHLHYLWNRKSVMIYSGPAWEAWNFNSMETTGIGGSEVWQTWLSRKLSELGYRVTVFADTRQGELRDGDVLWLPYTDYNRWSEQHWTDYAILSRTTDPLRIPLRAGKVYIQIHDVWMLSDRNQLFADKVTKYCALSDWHLNFASDYHSIPKEKMAIMANGIDFNRFDSVQVERNPYRLHWSSSWDRGLDNVLYLWPYIKQAVPEAELHCFYGTFNWRQSCLMKNDQEGLKKIAELEETVKQPGVFTYDRVSQKVLAEEIKKASLWFYPSWFSETFCCLPGTNVNTLIGYKDIETIEKGDFVYTHKGCYKEVTKVMSREVNGVVYEFRVRYLKDKLSVTGEHPLLIAKKDEIKCLRSPNACNKIGEKCKEGHCYYNKHGKKYYTSHSCRKLDEAIIPKWLDAHDVKSGDYSVYPINKNACFPGKFSDYLKSDKLFGNVVISGKARRGRPNEIDDFVIDQDFMEFCGWYVSEGCSTQSAVLFALNQKEEKEAIFIESQIRRLGLVVRREHIKDTKSMNVVTFSVILGRFLKDNFGDGAKNKYVPEWVKNLDKSFLKFFLKGVLKGDASVKRGCIVIESAGEKLVMDLFECLLKFGCISSLYNALKPKIYKEKGKIKRDPIVNLPAFRLACSMSQNISLFNFMGFNAIKSQKNSIHGFFDGDYVYLPVKVSKKIYIGKVYNLEVKDDNSYVANGVVVHNCITGVEAQYSGVPVICNKYAGVITTFGDSAVMLGNGDAWWPYTKEGREAFLSETVSMLKDRSKWQEWSDKGRENAKRYSWENCALRWKKLFDE
jgi:GT2 family glycosyltransferase/intein/homing endonuclease